MKNLSLVVLVILVIFAFNGCAKEQTQAPVERTGGKGMLGSVLSEKEKPMAPSAQTASRTATRPAVDISSGVLLVADFNSGTKPSNIGGDFGAWDKDPADFSQSCLDSFDPVNKTGSSGFGLKLAYDVNSPNPAYNGFWMKLNNLDASSFRSLVFSAKGDGDAGHTSVFKVELKNTKGEVGKFYVSNIDSEWKDIIIPLNKFNGISDFSQLTEFVIVFEDMMTTNKEGIIYIDDIRFAR